MRACLAFFCLGLASCAAVPRTLSRPPTDAAIVASVRAAFTEAKFPGTPEASKLRAAHPVSPGDWLVCLKSSTPDQRLRYALYFNDKFVKSQLAVQIDECDRETYVPVK